jgi:hypothetical protein
LFSEDVVSDWIPVIFLVGLFALSILMIEGANRMRGSGKR